MTDPTAWTPDPRAVSAARATLARMDRREAGSLMPSFESFELFVHLAADYEAALARIRALEAACEPFAAWLSILLEDGLSWPDDMRLGTRWVGGEEEPDPRTPTLGNVRRLAALLARKETP